MFFAETNEPSAARRNDGTEFPADLRRMTKSELRRLGTPRFVYLRVGTVRGEAAYAIHAADGRPVAIVEDLTGAVELATERGMSFVTVH